MQWMSSYYAFTLQAVRYTYFHRQTVRYFLSPSLPVHCIVNCIEKISRRMRLMSCYFALTFIYFYATQESVCFSSSSSSSCSSWSFSSFSLLTLVLFAPPQLVQLALHASDKGTIQKRQIYKWIKLQTYLTIGRYDHLSMPAVLRTPIVSLSFRFLLLFAPRSSSSHSPLTHSM